MRIKGVETERFQDYKYPSMFIAFPYCSFKCEKECGMRVCQNSTLATAPIREVEVNELIDKYLSNPITQAIVCGGLEPMDSFDDLIELISALRQKECQHDVVIYTGYRKEEITDQIKRLIPFGNIVIKFGRFIPNEPSHYDDVLGVNLANNEQYGERIC